MAGLGLMQAVQGYQQGLAWKQQQDQIARQQEAQARIDEANRAAADVFSKSKAEWAMNGAQGEYRPNDMTMLRAAEARGQHFAKSGDWDNFVRNEAAVQGQRARIRASALQQYELNGDPVALMQTVYPTIFDGKQIASVEKIGGTTGLSADGDPPAPPVLKFKLDDGTEGQVSPDDLVRRVKMTLVDPQRMAALEIQNNLQQALVNARTTGTLKGIEARGEQARTTEGVKHGNKVDFEGVRQENRLDLADVNNETRRDIARGNNDTARAVGAGHDAARVATAGAGRGGSSGGGAGGFQRTFVGADGFMYGIPRQGGDAVQITAGGQPIKSADWAKRVDKQAKTIGESVAGLGKSPAELRKLAEESLTGPASPAAPAGSPPAAGLGSFSRASNRPPGLADAAPTRVAPAAQAASDAKAGRLMITNEMGGDVRRAKSELATMRAEIARAPSREAKAILMEHANRLEAGIRDMEGSATAAPALPPLSSFKR